MSITVANVGGTMTGGSSVVLAFGGNTNGLKASYTAPTHDRLNPRTVDFLMTPARTTSSDPGVARAAMKIVLGNREVSEGCCGVQQGSVIFDVSSRWSLNQPDTLVDEGRDLLRAALFTAAFWDALKKGILPQ